MITIKDYIHKNQPRFIDELFDLIRIPSVSSKPEHKKDIFKAADYIRNALLNAGTTEADRQCLSGSR